MDNLLAGEGYIGTRNSRVEGETYDSDKPSRTRAAKETIVLLRRNKPAMRLR